MTEFPGKTYGDTIASGYARLHLGDVRNNHSYSYNLRTRRSDETLREDERNKRLLKAAFEGQTPRVQHLLELGASRDYSDELGLTALHHASLSEFDNHDTAQVLLKAGADVNATSLDCGTPLHLATLKAQKSLVQLLLKFRATVNSPSRLLGMPMHCAYYSGDAGVIELLKNSNAKQHLEAVVLPSLMRAISSEGDCIPQGSDHRPWQWDTRFSPSSSQSYLVLRCLPFHLAIANGHLALLDQPFLPRSNCYGAVMPELNEDSLKALCATQNILDKTLLATLFDQASSLAEFLKCLKPEKFGGEQRSALRAAFVLDSSRCLDFILDHMSNEKISWDDANEEIEFAIMVAGRKKDTACLQKLLSRCAQPRDEAKYSVLRTVLDTQAHALDCLLEHWQLPTAVHLHFDLTLLVANLENEQIMPKLILHGLDINAIRESSAPDGCCSPLMEVAKQGDATAVKNLLKHGASLDLLNQYGHSGLYMAADYGRAAIVSLLLEHGAASDLRLDRGRTALHFAVSSARREAVSILLDHGASLDTQDEFGATPLILAARAGHIHETSLLLHAGASPNLQDHRGNTALLSALRSSPSRDDRRSRKEVVWLLLEHDASVTIRNNEGIDALETCLDLESPDDRAECLTLLVEALENMHRRSMTPLHRYLGTVRQLQRGAFERNRVNLNLAEAELPQHIRKRIKEIQSQGVQLPDSTDRSPSTPTVPSSASKAGTKSAKKTQKTQDSVFNFLCDDAYGNLVVNTARYQQWSSKNGK